MASIQPFMLGESGAPEMMAKVPVSEPKASTSWSTSALATSSKLAGCTMTWRSLSGASLSEVITTRPFARAAAMAGSRDFGSSAEIDTAS